LNQLIFLVGLPGSGKTTLGKRLANEMGLSFADLDVEIEKEAGAGIVQIFEVQGEDYFRQLEAETLRKFSEKNNLILSTGGGTPCFFENMAWMNKKGQTVFVNTDRSKIIDRLKKQTHRPIFVGQNMSEKLEELWEMRKKFYEKAHHVVEPSITSKEFLGLLK
jgi:shikimate kinase